MRPTRRRGPYEESVAMLLSDARRRWGNITGSEGARDFARQFIAQAVDLFDAGQTDIRSGRLMNELCFPYFEPGLGYDAVPTEDAGSGVREELREMPQAMQKPFNEELKSWCCKQGTESATPSAAACSGK
mmetsp:Transcript_20921/g.60369  ORF Transcript_20921/g.60369 Transcript_20921/m.60369 type:complete len:130 (-) Transcript_20921:45-434(-)